MKVPCGGFKIDNDTLKLKNDGTLYAAGGGGSIPKPLTYDYMPEGYPSKDIGTVTLMEEQKVSPFTDVGNGLMSAVSPVTLELADGEKLTVVWDGVSYDTVVTMVRGQFPAFGNLGLIEMGDVLDYPFAYADAGGGGRIWATADTAASHTIKVTATKTVYNTMDANMLPKAGEGYGVVKKDEIVTAYVFPNNLAPQVEMNKAIDDFIAGKAKITWGSDNIISALRDSDTEIIIRTSDDPVNSYRYTVDERTHTYSKAVASALGDSEISVQRIYIKTEDGINYIGPITGVDNQDEADDEYIEYGSTRIYKDGIAIKSSDSSKMFKITVNDSGTISATEVT